MAGTKKPRRRSQVAGHEADYPAATLAFYGPDDRLATKAVAAVILSEEDPHPAAMREWHTTDTDIRSDPAVRKLMMEFLQGENVQRVVMADRILGCPHVEGVDYPGGDPCPYCPYWANRDRWTGQPLERE